ncbi:hypothetical protein COV22_00965, partial [Candidatus Woesearchaeota archaeon CG10_big_fil_rev_8_21_14_0_10_47_5]
FTQISAEKKPNVHGKININNNVTIVDVQTADLFLGSIKQPGLRFLFEYKSTYSPGLGTIVLGGEVLYMGDANKNSEILASWKKDKKVSGSVISEILNHVLGRCNIEALLISREVNLPPPIPLPRLKSEEKPEGKSQL